MIRTAGPRHRFRQSLLLGWVKMPVKDWLLLDVAPCDSYAILGPTRGGVERGRRGRVAATAEVERAVQCPSGTDGTVAMIRDSVWSDDRSTVLAHGDRPHSYPAAPRHPAPMGTRTLSCQACPVDSECAVSDGLRSHV